MNSKILSAALLAAALTAGTAEANPPGDDNADHHLQRMSEHLQLSADQQSAVQALMARSRLENPDDREAGRAAFEAGLQQILDAEQLQQFDDAPRPPRRGGEGRSRSGERPTS